MSPPDSSTAKVTPCTQTRTPEFVGGSWRCRLRKAGGKHGVPVTGLHWRPRQPRSAICSCRSAPVEPRVAGGFKVFRLLGGHPHQGLASPADQQSTGSLHAGAQRGAGGFSAATQTPQCPACPVLGPQPGLSLGGFSFPSLQPCWPGPGRRAGSHATPVQRRRSSAAEGMRAPAVLRYTLTTRVTHPQVPVWPAAVSPGGV